MESRKRATLIIAGLVATGGVDSINGGAGIDRLRGGDSADGIRGGRRGDHVWPGNGVDVVRTGPGWDSVTVRDDNRADRVNCGTGRDTVIIVGTPDPMDTFVDCEQITP